LTTLHQEVPKLFSQPERRGLVDKTTAQQSAIQGSAVRDQQELGFRKFSVKIP
jgi:hypothetical protein